MKDLDPKEPHPNLGPVLRKQTTPPDRKESWLPVKDHPGYERNSVTQAVQKK